MNIKLEDWRELHDHWRHIVTFITIVVITVVDPRPDNTRSTVTRARPHVKQVRGWNKPQGIPVINSKVVQ